MMLFRAVFITAFAFISLVGQVSAIILPLSRYMLDALPDSSDGAAAAVDALPESSDASVVGHTDVPVAAGTSAVSDGQADALQSSAVESAAAASEATAVVDADTPVSSTMAQANSAGHFVSLGSTSVLLGSVVAGLLLAA